MPAEGKHRRNSRTSPLARRLVALGTGGAALALPLITATTAGATPAPQHITAAPAAVHAASHRVIHVVVKGESLSKIARDRSVSGGWKALYKTNRPAIGDNPSLIHPGLKLKLSGKPVSAPKAPKAPSGTSSATGNTPAATTDAIETVAKSYTNDLDGWIREALDVMAQHGIPGSYDGIHRNIIRESSGNPRAINNWDSNAAAGTPSKGLLQVIDPTFQAYHVSGTSTDPYDPVANITAACNYAADRYGSIDNVNGPY
ncbi:LysM peptidoglycan-binding domain-containing protein [Streptomyces sp. NBC_01498]|uniref:LysM peptidoglycan-binding domain-containing protein n=1 Tax=Streptomyces sp. NBC_01498 TaxID=2975870 RepID=UPI002E7B06AF|nr:LysM peptidoglycan-binding domain-containing protein [Streptomyces sp. NBC_01498]WTL24183.1 LysM peptidoglycan-binding domain-containing protein [Streptomyces sp. NBC_01498]